MFLREVITRSTNIPIYLFQSFNKKINIQVREFNLAFKNCRNALIDINLNFCSSPNDNVKISILKFNNFGVIDEVSDVETTTCPELISAMIKILRCTFSADMHNVR
ncbi:hypothetical protein PUN28_018246 [Cardiocondyla obscurior]|uniref:Uncharacterized protein n=1 Tax=Cardiocondyla obscurior TaxID=286306 RepID=A0AAW2ELW4_9HYME